MLSLELEIDLFHIKKRLLRVKTTVFSDIFV